MPLVDPQLDDRTFEQLYAELRRRIPAYTPDWTDHNESDPGVAMLQLFCWLQEMQIWRLNQMPRKNYVKFLQYVAQDLRPAAAATVELKFTLSSKDPNNGVAVPAGTRVRSTSSSAEPVIFETDYPIVAIGGEIVQVQVFDGGNYTVISQDQIQSRTPFAPFSKTPQAGAALLLGFDRPFPPSAIPHRLNVHAVRADGKAIAPVDSTVGAVIRPADVVWEYYTGDPTHWTRLPDMQDATLAMTQPGIVSFTVSSDAAAQSAAQFGALQRPGDPLLYWVRCRINSLLGAGFQSLPLIEDVQTNTVSATNAVTQTSELLGASNGLPNQTFTLSGIPVLPDLSLKQSSSEGSTAAGNPGLIIVDEGSGYIAWTQVADFNASGPNDQHYTLDISTGLVTFGSGRQGKIPALLTQTSGAPFLDANIMAGAYRYGGGTAGNSGPDTITTLDDSIRGVANVTNPRSATGGADQETIDQAQIRLPKALRTQNRAVTATDFADLALLTPGVQIARAYALSQYHPTLSVARAKFNPNVALSQAYVPFPGVVTVFIIPYSNDPTDLKPAPNIDVCNLVAKQLNQSRLITTEVYVTGPNYRKVEVEVSVIVNPRTTLASVESALTKALLNYFNPTTGGDEGDGWEFGGTISITGTQRQVLIIDNVVGIQPNTLKIYVDDVRITQDLQLGVNEIVYSEQHQIEVAYA